MIDDERLSLFMKDGNDGAVMLQAEVDADVVTVSGIELQGMGVEPLVDACLDLLAGQEVPGSMSPLTLPEAREHARRESSPLALDLDWIYPTRDDDVVG